MRLYTPPERWDEEQDPIEIETYIPSRPFVLAPCHICGVVECGRQHNGHGDPIVIAISSVKCADYCTAACSVFCNVDSPYNKALLLPYTKLSHFQSEIYAAITALKQAKGFIIFDGTEEALIQTRQIIIKTTSNYLTGDKTSWRPCNSLKVLSHEYNQLLRELSDMHGGKFSIRLWKVPPRQNLAARRLASQIMHDFKTMKAEKRSQEEAVV